MRKLPKEKSKMKVNIEKLEALLLELVKDVGSACLDSCVFIGEIMVNLCRLRDLNDE